MKNDRPVSGKKTSDRLYLVGQHVGNLIGVLCVAPGLAYLAFVTFGNGTGDLLTVRVFIIVDIVCFMLIQTWGAVANTRKDYLRGKWKMESEPPAGAENRLVVNPWRMLLFPALAAGAATSAGVAWLLPRLGPPPFHFLNVGFIAGIPLFAVSAVIISRLVSRDQAAFTAALTRTRMSAVPFRRYFLAEHVLPWVCLQGCLNLAVGLKEFANEAVKHGGRIPASVLAQDYGAVAVIIVFFMWLSSMTQVRADVRLGRVMEDGGKAPIVPLMLLIILCFYGLACPIYAGLTLADVATVAPVHAAIAKALVAMAMVIPGCALGVWWGSRRETSLMRGAERINEEAREAMG